MTLVFRLRCGLLTHCANPVGRVIGIVAVTCIIVGSTCAQDRPQFCHDSPGDPFILGSWMQLKAYSKNEAIDWGLDFLIAPSRAKDRVVLYTYDPSAVDHRFFGKLEDQINNSQPKIAVVSDLSEQKLVFRGIQDGHFGVPVILNISNKSIVRDFVAGVADADKASRFLSAAIAISARKTRGLDFGPRPPPTEIERPWSAAIASSIPVEGPYRATRYVALGEGWDSCKNPPGTFATVSELESKLGTYR